jgi:hypothetical protein
MVVSPSTNRCGLWWCEHASWSFRGHYIYFVVSQQGVAISIVCQNIVPDSHVAISTKGSGETAEGSISQDLDFLNQVTTAFSPEGQPYLPASGHVDLVLAFQPLNHDSTTISEAC